MCTSKKLSFVTNKLGRIYINFTKNNLLFTITNLTGDVLMWTSSGVAGFKHSRKKTSLALQETILCCIKKLKKLNLRFVLIFIKQVGFNIDILLNLLDFNSLTILNIFEITTFSFNGCRLPKKRKI
uniref:Small ribosomal subunit protein uS11c n=1 Tax=Pteridomonas danica TaxID=38822 RepID=A0A7T1C545_9STRA|nr:ribosomal protein S11 [Pteridomonas danica]QPM99317.1 ribosomal protein S11 [Pteridomonas danica]